MEDRSLGGDIDGNGRGCSDIAYLRHQERRRREKEVNGDSNAIVMNVNAIRTIGSRDLAKGRRKKETKQKDLSDFDVSGFRREKQPDSDICR